MLDGGPFPHGLSRSVEHGFFRRRSLFAKAAHRGKVPPLLDSFNPEPTAMVASGCDMPPSPLAPG
jgi:hypothetical protein